MTSIRKSSMKVRTRYRSRHYRNGKGTLVVLLGLCFLIFAIYQVTLSRPNGGKETVESENKSFLKGSRDGEVTDNKIDDGEADAVSGEIQGKEATEEKRKEMHDSLSEEHEVNIQSDSFGDENGNDQGASGQHPYVFDPSHQIFHNYNNGKSGKVVEEMLVAHAYIFQQNATYGGCCGASPKKAAVHEDLLDALGLKGVLRFKCARDFPHDPNIRRSVIPKGHYLSEDTHAWTPDYVDYIRSLVTYPEREHKEYTIVVHMLRGNTSPCKDKNNGFQTYLPNLHYQNLIEKYMKPGARVIIYTSAKSFEALEDFQQKGYEVNTGKSLKDMWKDIVNADVFIMSRSDFSIVPAMVAKGTVVYTPFWHHPLRQWTRVRRSIMKQTDEETERLKKNLCFA